MFHTPAGDKYLDTHVLIQKDNSTLRDSHIMYTFKTYKTK